MRVYEGKNRIGLAIAHLIQPFISGRFVDAFVGGAQVIRHVQAKERLGNDLHPDLIHLWKASQLGWEPPTKKPTRQEWYDELNSLPSARRAFIGYASSDNFAFFMRYGDTFIEHRRNYKLARSCWKETVPQIQDVLFTLGDYRSIETRDNDVIFCDPPRFWRPNLQGYRSWAVPFDWYTFWDWCRAQKGLVFVCMKECPSDFVPIATFSARGNQPRPEMMFVARKHITNFQVSKNV